MRWVAFYLTFFLAVAVLVVNSNAKDQPVWLMLVIDSSSSIDAAEYDLQKSAYVTLLRDPEIVALMEESNVQIAIAEFSRGFLVIQPFTDDYELAASTYESSNRTGITMTNVFGAIRSSIDMLIDKPGRRVIDISVDGIHNNDVGRLYEAMDESTYQLTLQSRVEVNAIIIQSSANKKFWYEKNVVTGFVIEAEGFEEFEKYLRRKFVLEIS